MTKKGLAWVLTVGEAVCVLEGQRGPLHFSLSFTVNLKLRWEIKRSIRKEERERH